MDYRSTILNDQARNDKANAEPTVKILGLVWNAEADTLLFLQQN